ncbi:MAG: V-type ATPase subunit [Acidilobaceae archaeon]
MRIQLPWIAPLDYAKPIVIARVLKTRLLRPEVIKEISLAKDFEKAVSVLGESLYPEVREAKNLFQAETAVWRGYFRSVFKLAEVCPSYLKDVVLLFAREEELKDLMIIAQKVKLKAPLHERLPSMHYDTLVYSLIREPEKLLSLESMMTALKDTWVHAYLSEALSLVEEHRLEVPLYVFSAPYTVRIYSETLEPLSPIDLKDLEVLLCPRLKPLLFAGLVHSKVYGVPLEVLDTILRPISICGFDIPFLLEVYSRAIHFKDLAEDLGKTLDIKVVGESLDEVLSGALIGGGRVLRKIANKIMIGDPYRPAFIIAPLVLLRLEVEDVLLILSSKTYDVKPADFMSRLSVEV